MRSCLFLIPFGLAAAAISSGSDAAVTYSYTSTFFQDAVTVVVPSAISAQTVVSPIYCYEAGTVLADCAVLFDPIGAPAITFNGYALPPSPIYASDPTLDALVIEFEPGVTEFEGFLAGSFLANGTYTTAAGTLVVSGIPSPAPEPDSWAMMLVGFAATGAAFRARRKRAVSFG